MHNRIYEMAAQAISPSDEEKAMLDQLCSAAETELALGLRSGISVEDCGNIYIFAAALMGAADLMLLRSTAGADQFTAGDISIRSQPSSTIAAATVLRRQATALMAPFRRDDSFAFWEVQG